MLATRLETTLRISMMSESILGSRIEADGGLDEDVLDVSGVVHRNGDDTCHDTHEKEGLTEEGGIGGGVGTSDEDEAIEAEVLAGLDDILVLVFSDLVGTSAEKAEASGVAVGLQDLGGELDVDVVEETLVSTNETRQSGEEVGTYP